MPKLGPKLVFLPFSQVWLIRFPLNCMVIRLKMFHYKKVSNLVIEDKIHNILLGKFHLQSIVYPICYSLFQGRYKSSLKYDNIWYTTNDLNYSIGVKLESSTNDADDTDDPSC